MTPDAGWQGFQTDGGVGGASVDGPYTFWSSALTKVTVTGAYCHGDEFSVVDGHKRLSDTSPVTETLRNCSPRFHLSDIARADASMSDPTFSHGTFYLAPGSHSLNFVNKTIWNNTDPGSIAFFCLETTPLTFADCRAGGWKNFGTLFKSQCQCLLVATVTKLPTTTNVGPVSFATSPFGTAARGLTLPTPRRRRPGPSARPHPSHPEGPTTRSSSPSTSAAAARSPTRSTTSPAR